MIYITCIYEIGKARLHQTTNYAIFLLFTCYVYLGFGSLMLLAPRYIAYKPFTFQHSVI